MGKSAQEVLEHKDQHSRLLQQISEMEKAAEEHAMRERQVVDFFLLWFQVAFCKWTSRNILWRLCDMGI
jgi:hemerythrin